MNPMLKCALTAAVGMVIGALITHQWDFLWGQLTGMGLFLFVWRYIWREGAML